MWGAALQPGSVGCDEELIYKTWRAATFRSDEYTVYAVLKRVYAVV